MSGTEGLEVAIRQAGPIRLCMDAIVRPGETLAILGPSGAGKTTLLRAVAGLYRASEGRIAGGGQIWFDHRQRIDLPTRARRIGYVPQGHALFPHLTAIENVMEALTDELPAERRARAAAMLARVQLDGLADRRPRELSGGQQQRVALARALARDPAVLLLDEPFAAVDRPTRRALHALMADVRSASAVPILFVTHDVDDAVASADRIALLLGGEIVETLSAGAVQSASESRLLRWLEGR